MKLPRVGEEAGFQISERLQPCGDQPKAIEQLAAGLREGLPFQTLWGATGTGKTFTMAHVIQRVQRPTLVMAHNKTLTAQLANEFRELFPNNAVHYFVVVLRLLPAGGLHPADGHLHREGLLDQR